MKSSSKPPSSPSGSVSFQDELLSTIHGAFQVAVEITVLEVTKLLSVKMGELKGQVHDTTQENIGLKQKMGDLRGQVHESHQENVSLKQRLQEAEEQLELLRGYLGGGEPGRRTPGGPGGPPPPVLPSRRSTRQEEMKTEPQGQNPMKTEPQADPDPDPGPQGPGDGSATFREICADGRVLSQQYNPPETAAHHHHNHDSQEEMCGVGETESLKPPHRDPVSQMGDNAPPRHRHTEDNRICSVQLVRIKEEEDLQKEHNMSAADCCYDSMEDSLALVQSKMLEEWKPEMMDEQNHQVQDPVVPGPSSSRAMAPPSDVPQLSGSSSAPDFSSSPGEFCSSNNLLPPPPTIQPSSSSSSSSSQVYSVQVRSRNGRSHPAAISAGPAAPSLHVCKLCGQVFHAPSLLRRHYGQCQQNYQQQPHQQQQQQQQQTTTTARQQATSARARVQLYPPGLSPFRCTVCQRDFNRMENLKTHLRIHTGERPYTCSVCTKRFRHSGALKRHFRIHTGEKPYACAQCGKTFRNCGGLKFHQRAHSRQWEYAGNTHCV